MKSPTHVRLIVHTVILDDDGNALILHRAPHEVHGGQWDVPGGQLELGEDPEDGARRELREEAGITVGPLRLLHYTSNVDPERDTQFVRMIFVAVVHERNVTLNPDEHTEYRWVNPREPVDLPLLPFVRDCFLLLRHPLQPQASC